MAFERVTKQALVVAAAILVMIVIAVQLVPRFTPTRITLPAELGALPLQQHIFGDEARRIINQMHGKGVTPRANAIGLYADETGEATLYLSIYDEEEAAAATLKKMIDGIATGFTPFSDFEQRRIEGEEVAYCTGDGQAHFFFAVGKTLYWLAVDFSVADETLRALLHEIKPSAPIV
ncbi:MAG: hypothetical protein C4326_14930 [Ignavibacteria bacterium]